MKFATPAQMVFKNLFVKTKIASTFRENGVVGSAPATIDESGISNFSTHCFQAIRTILPPVFGDSTPKLGACRLVQPRNHHKVSFMISYLERLSLLVNAVVLFT